ncbi:preprotein translocase subunit SecE [Bowdeniella nasicola]|uniref:Protein translocase subunit SecE n=1 Tax=Bowdeniella nasicola TaxID=208480 RepID=A0A1Q5Q5K7_9ACTO|nr:preprotein translocase subunit SecE [Bowdeniella nasicola]OKL55105.1 preprotein translocase subunit SecE [Bowdeniella nasicola]
MSQSAETGAGKSRPAANREKRGLFARIALFYRQVVAELRKTVRPTKTELWTFFTVVLIFVLAVMAYVGVLDFVFGKLVLFIYGR